MMDKQKPKVFANQINKQINNCQKIYYSKLDRMTYKKPMKDKLDRFIKMGVNQKINALMSLPKYLYDVNLVITTEDEVYETNIVGKNNSSLITTDNKLIPIGEIVDISVKK